jgi:hypothetical protein
MDPAIRATRRAAPDSSTAVEIDLAGAGRVVLPAEFVDWVEAAGLIDEFRAYWHEHPWQKTDGGVVADFAVIEAAPRDVFDAIAAFIRSHDRAHVRPSRPARRPSRRHATWSGSTTNTATGDGTAR